MKLAVTDFGGDPSGPLLLLGPSLGTSVTSLWAACAARLTEAFHVVGWDLPGHGRSEPATEFDVPALAAAVLALACGSPSERFHYAGDSLGGAVGLQLLLDAPDRVIAATLACTGARIGDPEAWRARGAAVRAGGTAVLLESAPGRWFGPGFAERQPAAAQALLAGLADADDASYAAACEALADFDARHRLAEITAPVVAVAGTDDQVIPVAELRRIATGVQRGTLVALSGVAHLAPAEAPEEVAALVGLRVEQPVAPTTDRVRAAGLRVRREVLGDDHVDRALAGVTSLTAEFQQFITEYAWGGIWTRPGLDRRSRSLITLTALVAGGHHDELALHVRAALRNGVTVDEIRELLLQTAIYCGVPAANTAFRIAQRVLEDQEERP